MMFTAVQLRKIERELSRAARAGRITETAWTKIYCESMGLDVPSSSNLDIDINEDGHGREMKVLGVSHIGDRVMHPSITRTIRINSSQSATDAMVTALTQYGAFVKRRIAAVARTAIDYIDIAFGMLLYDRPTLSQFWYFETPMVSPDPSNYYAEWRHHNSSRRIASPCLWVFEKDTGIKRFSITSDAGAKVQMYFDVRDAVSFKC